MPRLLSISTLFPTPQRPGFGGFVERQMQALAARGDWEVTVVNPVGLPPVKLARYADAAASPLVEQRGPIAVHRPRFTLIPGIGGRFNPALVARAILPLARRLHAERPFDMVDAQFFYPDGPAALRVASALGLPFAVKARGSDIHYWGRHRYAREMMVEAANEAAAVLAVSGALAADMAALGMPGEKIRVHYTGLDRTRFRVLERSLARERIAARADWAVPPAGHLLLSVGALVPVKGHDLAIAALAHLSPGTHLAIAGTGELDAALREQAARRGLADRVHFLGAVGHETLPVLLSAADAMVLPSEREGLANAWIEALACGTPLVIPAVGGAPEVVCSPAAGRLAERSAEAIAAAVRDLLERPPAQDDVAAAAARFSWETCAAELAEAYSAVLGR